MIFFATENKIRPEKFFSFSTKLEENILTIL